MKMSEALDMDFESTERRNRLTTVGAAFIGKEGGREGGREGGVWFFSRTYLLNNKNWKMLF